MTPRAWGLLGFLIVLLLCGSRHAFAGTFVWQITSSPAGSCNGGAYSTAAAAGSGDQACVQAALTGVTVSVQCIGGSTSGSSCTGTCSDPPTAAGQTCRGILDTTPSGGGSTTVYGAFQISSVNGGTGTCSKSAGTYDIVPPGNTAAAAGTTACGIDNCNYTMGPPTSARTVMAVISGKQAITQTATTTGGSGASCTYGASPAAPQSQVDTGQNVQDCQNAGGLITCATQDNTGKYCGTYNGDEVCVGSVPPGTCQQFASGGVACTVAAGKSATSPPAPDNGTAGTPAAPTGSVAQSVSGTTTTTNYYSSSVVSGSHTPAATTGVGTTGTPTGGSTSGSGSGTGGSGSAPNGANGDCGASSVDCSGDGALPTLDAVPTVESALQTYYAALSAVPVVAAVSGVSHAFDLPSGATCPTADIPFFAHTITMDSQCGVWDSVSDVLGALMLALYTVWGVKILMST